MKVRDILKLLADDGWEVVRTSRSHRQMKHPEKKGRSRLQAKPVLRFQWERLRVSVNKQTSKKSIKMGYAVVIEKGDTSFGAYVPDLPGCVAVGETREETMTLIREAIEFHLEGMKAEGQEVPEPHSEADYVDVLST